MDGVPRRVEDLVFERRKPRELLNLTEERETPDPDFYAFGWGLVPGLTLRGDGDSRLGRALVLGLHSADEQPPGTDAIELEFDIDLGPDPDDYVAIMVPLPVFLAQRLPALLEQTEVDDVVLALCNPHRRIVTPPEGVAGVRLWWAEGDVESWFEAGRYVLTAERWHATSLQETHA